MLAKIRYRLGKFLLCQLIAVAWICATIGSFARAQTAPNPPLPVDYGMFINPPPPFTSVSVRAYSGDDYVRDAGKWSLTRSDALEIVAALEESASAHYTALSFLELSLKSFGPSSTAAERAAMSDNLKKCAESAKRTLARLELWKKRAALLRD